MTNVPEYRKIRQYVLDSLLEHHDPEQRIASEREIATQMNVSRLTVRYALKEMIKDGLLYVQRGKGTFVNPSQIRGFYGMARRNHKVMILWNDGTMLMLDGFFTGILEQLCGVFKSVPVFIQNSVFTGGNSSMAEEIRLYRPDGIIWCRPNQACRSLIIELRQKIPVCELANAVTAGEFSIGVDFYQAGVLVAEHLHQIGCKKVAFIGYANSVFYKQMLNGWKTVWTKNSQEISMNNIDWDSQLDELLKNKPEGLFVFGHCFQFLDQKLAGQPRPDLYIVIDENNWGTYGTLCRPNAKIMLSPPEMSRFAAKELFRAMEDKTYQPDSRVFNTEIIRV